MGGEICETFDERPVALSFDGRIGYRAAPLIGMDLAFSFAMLWIEEDSHWESGSRLWFSVRSGISIYPLGSRRMVDLVIGAHMGYLFERYANDDLGGSSGDGYRWNAHGLIIEESVGFLFHIGPMLGLGLRVSVFQPLPIKECSSGPHDVECESYEGEYDTVYFRPAIELSGTFD